MNSSSNEIPSKFHTGCADLVKQSLQCQEKQSISPKGTVDCRGVIELYKTCKIEERTRIIEERRAKAYRVYAQTSIENALCDMGLFVQSSNFPWTCIGGFPVSLCGWFGVTCDSSSVVKITLENSEYVGSLPTSIGQISTLTSLRISGPTLTGTIPTSIGSLTLLTEILLSSSSIAGIIPTSIGDATALVSIDLSSNSIVGSIPSEMGKLLKLETINLSSNLMTGTVPASMAASAGLTSLNIYNNQFRGTLNFLVVFTQIVIASVYLNQFTGVFPSLASPNLRDLLFQHNKLHGPLPPSLCSNCPTCQLGTLNLEYNQFTGTVPTSLAECTHLTSLNLGNNLLGGSVPSELITMGTLEYLGIDSNGLIGSLPTVISVGGSFTSIVLSNNLLTGVVPSSWSTAYDILYITGNHMQDNFFSDLMQGYVGSTKPIVFFPGGVVDQTNCDSSVALFYVGTTNTCFILHLIGSNFGGTFPSTVSFLSASLVYLDLSSASLVGTIPSSIGDLSVLTSLAISHCDGLSGAIPSSIGSLSKLVNLFITFNRGISSSIPFSFSGLTNLADVRLTQNQLTGTIPTSIGDATSITAMLFQLNSFSGSIPAEIGKLRLLTFINLGVNKLAGSLPSSLALCTALSTINFQSNNLQGSLSILSLIANINFIILNDNSFSGPFPVFVSSKLVSISLQNNKLIGSIAANICESCPGLISFSLANNKITGSIPSSLPSCTSLSYLKLDSNSLIGSIPSPVFSMPKLGAMQLNNNFLIGTLPSISLSASLTTINLSDNCLTGAVPKLWEPQIAKLFISNNRLQDNFLSDLMGVFIGTPVPLSFTVGGVAMRSTMVNSDKLEIDFDGTTNMVGKIVLNSNDISGSLPSSIGYLFGSLSYLLISGSSLVGSLPSSLGDLSLLTQLSIASCLNLIGEIPSSIGKLVLLSVLSLSNNPFSGTLFSSIGKLAQLQSLTISSNSLIGSIPPSIGDMTALTYINLARNLFTGSIPSEIGKLRNLFTLLVNVNNLFGPIPSSIGDATALSVINLQANSLTGSIPSAIERLMNLRSLFIDNNKIDGTISPSIGKLTNLQSVTVSVNELTGTIPSALVGATALTSINFSSNSLGGKIPFEVGKLSKLKIFNFAKNKLTSSIPSSIGLLTNLVLLNLGSNNLLSSIPTSLRSCTGLTSINLGSCQFSGSVNVFAGFTLLVNLVISSNMFSGNFPSLASMNIRFLEVSSNLLNGTLPYDLGLNYVKLVNLMVDDNAFTGSIPSSIFTLPLLTNLALANNFFSGSLPHVGLGGSIGKLTLDNNLLTGVLPLSWNIFIVSINGNHMQDNFLFELLQNYYSSITPLLEFTSGGVAIRSSYQSSFSLSISFESINGMVTLLALYAQDAPYQLPSTIVYLSKSLQYLQISGNQLSGSIPSNIGLLTTLTALIVVDCDILSGPIPYSVGDISSLQKLQIEFVEVSSNISFSFAGLTNLEYLSVSHTQLTGSIPTSLGEATALTSILLRYNNLFGTIPSELGKLNSLREIDLSSNKLTGWIPSVFADLPLLQLIAFSFNLLSGVLGFGEFGFSSLSFLSLSINYLTGPFPSMDNLRSVSVLDLSGNFLNGTIPGNICDSFAMPHLEHLNLEFNLFAGSLPSSLHDCTSLHAVHLDRNVLDGSIPWFSPFPALQYFTAAFNSLTSSIPSFVFPSVFVFDLSYNNLVGNIPPDLIMVGALVVLRLSSNNIEGLVPLQCSNSLTDLRLDSNFLSGPIPDSLYEALDLAYLHLFVNSFTGPLSSRIGDLTSLVELKLHNNTFLSNIPSEISNIHDMTFLSLNFNSFFGIIPDEMKYMVGLKKLYLNNNALEGGISSDLVGLQFLEEIWLSRNSLDSTLPPALGSNLLAAHFEGNLLTGYVPSYGGSAEVFVMDNDLQDNALCDLNDLTKLGWTCSKGGVSLNYCAFFGVTCSGVWVTELDIPLAVSGSVPTSIGGMKELVFLNMSSPTLTGQIPSQMGKLNVLKTLDLRNSKLSGTIPSELAGLLSLTELYLQNNVIEGAFPTFVGDLTLLCNIDLSLNTLTGSIDSTFSKLVNLLSFNIANNKLSGLIFDKFGTTVNKLSALVIENNKFNDLVSSNWAFLISLNILKASSNRIHGSIPSSVIIPSLAFTMDFSYNCLSKSIPESFWLADYLSYLDLSHNILSGTLSEQITTLNNLDYVNLSFNMFNKGIPDYFLAGAFRTLDFSNNMFSSANCVTPTRFALSYVDFSFNRFSSALPTCILQFTRLTYLDLSEMSLSSSLPTEFVSLVDLNFLNLRNNKFVGIIPTGMSLNVLKNMNIAGNMMQENYICDLPGYFSSDLLTEANMWKCNGGFVPLSDVCAWNGVGCSNGFVTNLTIDKSVDFPFQIPRSIFKLSNLKSLELHVNAISDTFPDLSNFYSLVSLNLVGNLLTGNIPSTSAQFPNIANLETLIVRSNKLSGQLDFSQYAKLKVLDLKNNNYAGRIPFDKMGNLLSLTVANFAYNSFSSTLPLSIASLTSLQELVMNNNQLTGSFAMTVSDSMQVLQANHNKLSGVIPTSLCLLTSPDLNVDIRENNFECFPYCARDLNILKDDLPECFVPSAAPTFAPTSAPDYPFIYEIVSVENYIDKISLNVQVLGYTIPSVVFCQAYRDLNSDPTKDEIIRSNNFVIVTDKYNWVTVRNLIPDTTYAIFCVVSTVDGDYSNFLAHSVRYKLVGSTVCCKTVTVDIDATVVSVGVGLLASLHLNIPLPSDSIIISLSGFSNDGGVLLFNPSTFNVLSSVSGENDAFLSAIDIVGVAEGSVNIVVDISGPSVSEYLLVYGNLGDTITVYDSALSIPEPALLSAIFADIGDSIVFSFSTPTDRSNFIGTFSCSSLFVCVGCSLSTCKFIDSQRVLMYPDISVVPDTVISLQSNVLFGDCSNSPPLLCASRVASVCSSCILVQSPVNPVSPVIVAQYPQYIPTCSLFSFDITQSTGNGGRLWSLVSLKVLPKLDVDTTALQSFLSSYAFEVPPLTISGSVFVPGVDYVINATLCNFLASCTSSLFKVISPTSVAFSVSILGSREQIINAFNELSLRTFIPPICAPGHSYDVQYTWTVRHLGFFPVDVKSISINPAEFVVASSTFTPGEWYTIILEVREMTSGLVSTTNIRVSVLHGNLIPKILGGTLRTIRFGDVITVDATDSFDEDHGNLTGTQLQSVVNFSWTCKSIYPVYSTSCDYDIMIQPNRLLLTVDGSRCILNTTSRVNLVMYDDSRFGNTYIDLVCVDPDSPLMIALTLNRDQNKPILLSNILRLHSVVTSRKPYEVVWEELIDGDSSDSVITSVRSPIEYLLPGNVIKYSNYLVIPSFSLSPRAVYQFSIRCRSMIASVTVNTNGGPYAGSFFVSPSVGVELSQSFQLSAKDWYDQDLPILFEFGYENELGDLLSVQSFSEIPYANLLLPSTASGITQARLRIFDSVGAYTDDRLPVVVSSSDIRLDDILSELLSSSSSISKIDKNKLLVAVMATMMNQNGCFLAPNCANLNRHACTGQSNQCGPCLDGYYGDSGSATTACYSASVIDANACSADPSCSNIVTCVTGACIFKPKACISSCSGHGNCHYRDVNTNDILTDCLMNDPTCTAECVCSSGFYGRLCSITSANYYNYVDAHEFILLNLLNITNSENSWIASVLSWINSIVSSTRQWDQLSEVSLRAALNICLRVLEEGYDLDYDQLSVVFTALDSISLGITRLQSIGEIDAAGAIVLFSLYKQVFDGFSAIIMDQMVLNEFPYQLSQSQFRVQTTVYPIANGLIIDEPATFNITVPESETDTVLGRSTPTVTLYVDPVESSDVSLSATILETKACLLGVSGKNFSANPITLYLSSNTDLNITLNVTLPQIRDFVPYYNNSAVVKLTVCPHLFVGPVLYECPGGGVVTHYCNGSAGIFDSPCPNANSTMICSTDSKLHCEPHSNKYGEITCVCTQSRRRERVSSDVHSIELVTLIETEYSGIVQTFRGASEFGRPNGAVKIAQSSFSVVLMFIAVWGISVILAVYLFFYGFDKKLIEGDIVDAAIKEKKFALQRLKRHIQTLFPAFYVTDGNLATRIWREIKTHHSYFSIFFVAKTVKIGNKRLLLVVKYLTLQSLMLFAVALTMDIENPVDDGSCQHHYTRESCLSRRSPFDTGKSYCEWVSTINSDVIGQCYYASYQTSWLTVALVAILTAIITAIVEVPTNIVFKLLGAPMAARSMDEVSLSRSNVERTFALTKQNRRKRGIVAPEPDPEGGPVGPSAVLNGEHRQIVIAHKLIENVKVQAEMLASRDGDDAKISYLNEWGIEIKTKQRRVGAIAKAPGQLIPQTTTTIEVNENITNILKNEIAEVEMIVEDKRSELMLMETPAMRGVKLIHEFMIDCLDRRSQAAKIFQIKVEEDFQMDAIVSVQLKVIGIVAVVVMNVFFFGFAILRSSQRGGDWQRAYIQACIFQLIIEAGVFETTSVIYASVLLPYLVEDDVTSAYVSTMRAIDSMIQQVSQEEELVNVGEVFYVSNYLARSFPDLPESVVISQYRTIHPYESLSDQLQSKKLKNSLSSTSVKVSKTAQVTSSGVWGKVQTIFAVFTSFMLLPLYASFLKFCTMVDVQLQLFILGIVQPVVYSAIWYIGSICIRDLYRGLALLCIFTVALFLMCRKLFFEKNDKLVAIKEKTDTVSRKRDAFVLKKDKVQPFPNIDVNIEHGTDVRSHGSGITVTPGNIQFSRETTPDNANQLNQGVSDRDMSSRGSSVVFVAASSSSDVGEVDSGANPSGNLFVGTGCEVYEHEVDNIPANLSAKGPRNIPWVETLHNQIVHEESIRPVSSATQSTKHSWLPVRTLPPLKESSRVAGSPVNKSSPLRVPASDKVI